MASVNERTERLLTLLREAFPRPDKWGYAAAYQVMNDDLRARVYAELDAESA